MVFWLVVLCVTLYFTLAHGHELIDLPKLGRSYASTANVERRRRSSIEGLRLEPKKKS